jgi:hypothetical protein
MCRSRLRGQYNADSGAYTRVNPYSNPKSHANAFAYADSFSAIDQSCDLHDAGEPNLR